jgi:uncharacterized protein YbbC (DUF1343 family)
MIWIHIALLGVAGFAAATERRSVQEGEVQPGAARTDAYFPVLQGKRVAVLTNHTGMVGNEHLIDMLVRSGFHVTAIFSPEHGFRGNAGAGEHVADSVDAATGIPVFSLYGNSLSVRHTRLFDVAVVDLQDVGLRFYTYYITMMRMMETCALHRKTVIVLDRPNPNGHYVDGPILDMKHRSGVGAAPIPIVHGMTIGELAEMCNGEGWLAGGVRCELLVARCNNYTHHTAYRLPVAPSPNLPNMKAVYLYPSLCLFEGTVISLGRGTDFPFQVYGHPDMKDGTFSFTPHSVPAAKNPPHCDKLCRGMDLRHIPDEEIYTQGICLDYVIHAYRSLNIGEAFFTPFFEKLTGVDYIRRMICEGKTSAEIKAVWKDDVERFETQRKPYLLYDE